MCRFIPQIQVFLQLSLTPWSVLNTLYTFFELEEIIVAKSKYNEKNIHWSLNNEELQNEHLLWVYK